MEPIVYIKYYEFLLLPVYLFLFFWMAKWIVKIYYPESILSRFFFLGLAAKLFGSIVFALISQYFFKEGDTFMYFSGGLDFKEFAFKNFPDNINLFFLPSEEFGKFYELNSENVNNFGYLASAGNLFTAKISGFFSLFTFNGYLLTSLLFGLVAFSGMWRLFILFSKIYPQLIKQCSWCFLLLPSILFWGGGVMKDTICLGAIGWLFSSFYIFFILKKKAWLNFIMIFIAAYVLIVIKLYIAVTIISVLIIWVIMNSISSIKKQILRRITTAVTIFLIFTLLFIFFDQIMIRINDEAVTFISETIKGATKNYNNVNTEGGAALSNIEDVQPNILSILSKVPIAINNALFRPYIWEARKLNILLSALENTAILLLTIFIFLRRGIFKTLVKICSNQLIFICFSFSILFAILIGLTCFNYGSLVRYKLPIMPFYGFMLILLYYTDKNGKLIV